LPASQTVNACHFKQGSGNRSTDDSSEWSGRQKESEGSRSFRRGDPVSKVKNHAGEESRLSHSKQEPKQIETERSPYKHHTSRNHTPRDHDARNPNPSADSHHDQIAGYLEENIADKKHTGPKPIHYLAKAEIAAHLQRGKAHVEAVEVIDDVAEKDIRHDPARDLSYQKICVHAVSVKGPLQKD